MDCPSPCVTQQGAWTNRPLKCGNLQYKWIVLIWLVECCTLAERTHCEILFVTLCSLTLQTPFPLTTLLGESTPNAYLLFWSLLLPTIYRALCVFYLSLLHLFFSRSNVWSLKRNRQRLSRRLPAVLKSTQLPPTVASPCSRFLLPPVSEMRC